MNLRNKPALLFFAGSSAGSPDRAGTALCRYGSIAIILLITLTVAAFGQTGSGSAQNPPAQPEGVKTAGYTVHQSIEFGYRFNDTIGNHDMYSTLVNLQQGPRVLSQTFSMQSDAHAGLLFDNFFVNSVGWGGDPNNYLRARVDKGKWYNLLASFRRDQNFFDYNLLANPLNPSTSSPSLPILDSPHQFSTTRRMTDVDLTILPQSKLSFRLGYSRNNMTGSSFSSVHEGTDASLFQPWNTTLNEYRIGVDWTVQPRTVISYDQTLQYFKGDTNYFLDPTFLALLPGGAGSVDLGLPFNTAASQPCAIPTGQTSLIDATGTLTNTACSGYFNYARIQRVRTSVPTERISLRSNYFERLDLTASYAYSSADMTTPLTEGFDGLIPRTRTRAFLISGEGSAQQVSNVAELGVTFRLTNSLRIIDNFYFWYYRMPQHFASTEVDLNVAGSGTCRAPSCSLLVPLSSTVPATVLTDDLRSFNQDLKRNQIELAWDISKKLGARVGYRYGNRNFVDFVDFLTGDVDEITIHEHTALAGVWARPMHNLRLNFDFEHTNNDDFIVRIAPRKQSRYRAQATYTPRPWATVGAAVSILEDQNSNVEYRGHYRNYGMNLSLAPRERFSIDLAYNFNDVLQSTLICFNDTPPAGVVLPVVANAASCRAFDTGNPLLTDGFYVNNTHFGMGTIMIKPVKRLTTRVGYSITSVDGKTPVFNNLQPLGPLAYNWHQPVADFSVDLGHNVAWNAGWNYYQYNEKSFVGPTARRYFHANNATVSLTYAF